MDDSTARMFRLVLVLLMVFTEKLHEAINTPPHQPPPLLAGDVRPPLLLFNGNSTCGSGAC